MDLKWFDEIDHSNKTNPECLQICGRTYLPILMHRKGNFTGMLIGMLNEIAKERNICYNMVYIPNSSYGTFNPDNKTFDGTLGLLQKHTCEIILAPLSISYIRKQYFDVSQYLFQDFINVMLKYPTLEPNLLGFIMPLEWKVWSVLGIAFLVTIMTLFFFLSTGVASQWGVVKRGQQNPDTQPSKSQILVKVTMTTVRTFLSQELNLKNNNSAVEVLVGAWLVFSLFVGLSYKCNLKAMLILPKVSLPFTDFAGMVEQDKMGWIITRGHVFCTNVLQKAPDDSIYGRMYKGLSGHPTSITKAIEMSANGEKAQIGSDLIITSLVHITYDRAKKCTLTKLKLNEAPRFNSILFHKNSKYLDILNKRIVAYIESGILVKSIEMANKYAERCLSGYGKTSGINPLGMKDLYGIFGILIAGCLIAFLVFLMEVASGTCGF